MTFCPHCGAQTAGGAYCGSCGRALAAPPTGGTPPPPAPGSWSPTPAMAPAAPMAPKTRPTGIAILAVFSYIGAGIFVLMGIVFLAGGSMFADLIVQEAGQDGALAGGVLAAMGAIIGVIFFVLGGLIGLQGWGLWSGKAWAWVLALVIEGLSAASNLFGLVRGQWSSILGLAIAGFIIWYLLQPGVKAWFGRT